VRLACLTVVQQFASYNEGAKALVEASFVELLLARCKGTPDGGPPIPEVQAIAVTGLGRVCQTEEGCKEAIRLEAVPTALAMLMSDAGTAVQYQSAFCLAVLTYEQAEKRVALDANVMPKLVYMLGAGADKADEAMRLKLRTAAAALLMSMANGTRDAETGENACKPAAVEAGACKVLVPLMREALEMQRAGELTAENSELAVYVAKCMASLADSPKGRKQLKVVLPELTALTSSSESTLGKHASIAIERITWEP